MTEELSALVKRTDGLGNLARYLVMDALIFGRASSGQALVFDQAASRLAPPGFDPSRKEGGR